MPNLLIDEDTGLLAAEFVLGTLDSAERANAQSLLKADPGFTAMVRIWERRFGELHLMVEPVDPDAAIFERIKAKLATMLPPEPIAGKLPDLPADPPPEPPPPAMATGEGEVSKAPEGAAGDETPTAQGEPPLPEEAATAVDPSVVPEVGPPPAPGDEQQDPRREATIDVIRSRRRWRALGIFMTLVVVALAGLVAAWKVVPDRLPPVLRPAEVMMAIGIEPRPGVPQPPAFKRVPPESQFDE
jgi:hypothetical protein